MENNNIAFLLTGFVILILGVALIAPVAELILGTTGKQVATDEAIDISSARNDSGEINATVNSFTITNFPSGWKIADCPITDVTYGNSSTDYTLTTDYTFTDTTGVLRVVVGGEADTNGVNSTFVDYTYCSDDYINVGWARSILNLVSGFFALALLLASIALFYNIARNSGVID